MCSGPGQHVDGEAGVALGRDVGEFRRDGLEKLGAVDRRAIGGRADLDGAQFSTPGQAKLSAARLQPPRESPRAE